MTSKYFSREQRVQGNMGTVDLVIVPYDWIAGTPIPSGIEPLRKLSLSLYESKPNDLDHHGDQLPAEFIRILPASDYGTLRTQRIHAPGGTVFLKIDGRGRAGEWCAPSWIRIQSFPGYRTDDIKNVVVWVPTCQATFADTVMVESGPFIYGGAGEPRSKHFGEADYTEPEQIIGLPAFAIDRTEVSNAAFALFGQLERTTGYPATAYSPAPHAHDADPAYPVRNVDAFEAKAYCEYMGKYLPSEHQWTKAARGGLTISHQANPHPRRLYPWGTDANPQCVNQFGDKDGYPLTAPVDSFPCGASPYGVLNLSGICKTRERSLTRMDFVASLTSKRLARRMSASSKMTIAW